MKQTLLQRLYFSESTDMQSLTSFIRVGNFRENICIVGLYRDLLDSPFRAGFIYRITPQLSGATGGGNFFTPFEDSVWIASLITLTAILVILKFSVFIIFKSTSNEPNTSLISYLVDIVGTVSQQGIAGRVSARMPIRIILFSLLTLNLVLFNYYTSSVVGGLLSSPGKGPQTIREIIDSPLKLAFRDIGYHKILFRVS